MSYAKCALKKPWKIHPGIGIRGIPVGSSVACFVRLLGKPDRSDGEGAEFFRRGMELIVTCGSVTGVAFHFRTKRFMTFDGATEKGIGFLSSIPDVFHAYGEPEHIGGSIVSNFGGAPGAYDYTLVYDKRGIRFTFYDNDLAHIVVFQPRCGLTRSQRKGTKRLGETKGVKRIR